MILLSWFNFSLSAVSSVRVKFLRLDLLQELFDASASHTPILQLLYESVLITTVWTAGTLGRQTR